MEENRKYSFVASLLDSLEYISSYSLKFIEVMVILLGLMLISTYIDASGITELAKEINGAEKVIVLDSTIILLCIELFRLFINRKNNSAIGFKLICMFVVSCLIQFIPPADLLTLQAVGIFVGFRLIAGFFYRIYFTISPQKSILVEKECRTVLKPMETVLDISADDNEEKELAETTN